MLRPRCRPPTEAEAQRLELVRAELARAGEEISLEQLIHRVAEWRPPRRGSQQAAARRGRVAQLAAWPAPDAHLAARSPPCAPTGYAEAG